MSGEIEVMQPEFREITLKGEKGDHVVKVRTSLPARDYIRLKNHVISRAELKAQPDGYKKNGSPKMSVTPSINGADITSLETETVQAYVMEFDGDANNAYNRMLDHISGRQYEEVKAVIDELFAEETKK